MNHIFSSSFSSLPNFSTIDLPKRRLFAELKENLILSIKCWQLGKANRSELEEQVNHLMDIVRPLLRPSQVSQAKREIKAVIICSLEDPKLEPVISKAKNEAKRTHQAWLNSAFRQNEFKKVYSSNISSSCFAGFIQKIVLEKEYAVTLKHSQKTKEFSKACDSYVRKLQNSPLSEDNEIEKGILTLVEQKESVREELNALNTEVNNCKTMKDLINLMKNMHTWVNKRLDNLEEERRRKIKSTNTELKELGADDYLPGMIVLAALMNNPLLRSARDKVEFFIDKHPNPTHLGSLFYRSSEFISVIDFLLEQAQKN